MWTVIVSSPSWNGSSADRTAKGRRIGGPSRPAGSCRRLFERAEVRHRVAQQRRPLVGTVDRFEAEAPHDRVAGAHAGTVDQADALRPLPVVDVALAAFERAR